MTYERGTDTGQITGIMRDLNIDSLPHVDSFPSMSFEQLVSTKKLLDTRLYQLFDILLGELRADMNTPLTVDGFPRSDIDVVGIRLVRVNIIRLRNDLLQVMQHIDKQLGEQLQKQVVNESAEPQGAIRDEEPTQLFATVLSVDPKGPAAIAGLEEGDRVVMFKNVTSSTEHKQDRVILAVRASIEGFLPVTVQRDTGSATHTLQLQLRPNDSWGGRGMLGCQVKIDE